MNPPAWGGDYVTTRQVADYLGVHVRTVQRYARDGLLPSYLLPGDGLRFKREDVETFLRPNHHNPPNDEENNS